MTRTTQEMKTELVQLFARFDLDKDGHISEKEFGQLLHALNVHLPGNLLSAEFAKIDRNSDGSMQFQEFVDWWLDYN